MLDRNAIREVKHITGLSRSYRKHVHDELSVAHVWGGSSLAWIDGHEVPVAGECVVVIRPGVAHACNPAPGSGWSYTLALLDQDLRGMEDPYRILPSTTQLREAFQGLRNGRSQGMPMLFDALESFEEDSADPARHLPVHALRRVMAHLRSHVAAPLDLSALGAVAGLSKYHLVRAFRAAYGLTPHAYHLNLRVNEAKARLARGEDLATVAQECGFCDQGHFTRVFARCVGMTPGAYRRVVAGSVPFGD